MAASRTARTASSACSTPTSPTRRPPALTLRPRRQLRHQRSQQGRRRRWRCRASAPTRAIRSTTPAALARALRAARRRRVCSAASTRCCRRSRATARIQVRRRLPGARRVPPRLVERAVLHRRRARTTCGRTRTPRSSAWCGGSATRQAPGRRLTMLLGMVVLGLVDVRRDVRLRHAVRPRVGDVMTVLVAVAERRRVRVPGVRDAAAGEVLRLPWAPNTSPSRSRSCSRSPRACRSAATCSRCSPASARCSIRSSCRSSGWCCALTGVDPTEQQDWKQYSVSLLVSNVVMWLATFAIVSLQQRAAAQSRRHRQHGADARVQHDLELHDQHEPAALQRRDRPVVLLADVRDHVPAVRDRRHRRRGLHRDHPRAGRQPADARSATSTSTCTRATRPRVPAAGAAGVGRSLMWQGTPMTFEGAAKATTRRRARSRRSRAA